MTIKEIIDGLKFTVEMFMFDPTTGETYKEPRNDMDKTTIDACNGAIELLEQQPCEDVISRESVIEWLKDKDIIKTKNQEENARRELAELPSVTPSYNSVKSELEQTRWIPVSERLPKEGQKVLTTDKFEAVATAIYCQKSPFWKEMVVAWMPRPKPYKPESEE